MYKDIEGNPLYVGVTVSIVRPSKATKGLTLPAYGVIADRRFNPASIPVELPTASGEPGRVVMIRTAHLRRRWGVDCCADLVTFWGTNLRMGHVWADCGYESLQGQIARLELTLIVEHVKGLNEEALRRHGSAVCTLVDESVACVDNAFALGKPRATRIMNALVTLAGQDKK